MQARGLCVAHPQGGKAYKVDGHSYRGAATVTLLTLMAMVITSHALNRRRQTQRRWHTRLPPAPLCGLDETHCQLKLRKQKKFIVYVGVCYQKDGYRGPIGIDTDAS